ncbi:MAG: hypothetical protein HYY24_17850 [Verrucomicrobia bacterium]|nr:hypothetical protein [Verrucomicrobiota bacterium]
MSSRTPPTLLIALCVLVHGSAWACKYSVRDVGFVGLEAVPYRVCCFVHRQADKDFAELLKQTASVMFFDANVELELIDPELQTDHAAMRLARAHNLERFPAAILVSADERSLPLPIDLAAHQSVKDQVWSLLEGIISSRRRDELLRQLPAAYAVVVLVESKDAAANERARLAIRSAIAEITQQMPQMPKPVKVPPQMLALRPDEVAAEATWLWGLGLEIDAAQEPQVAVLYGRGRRIGPNLGGPQISAARLREILAVIGQDCECDLDRSWMQGPVIPARWDGDMRETVLKSLGFDPESPLVKVEISQILARGPIARPKAAGGDAALDNLLFSYREVSLGDDSQPAASNPPNEDRTAQPRAQAVYSSASPGAAAAPPRVADQPAALGVLWLGFGGVGVVALAGGGWLVWRARRND